MLVCERFSVEQLYKGSIFLYFCIVRGAQVRALVAFSTFFILNMKHAHSRQLTDTVLMIEPLRFGYNPEAAESNSFMEPDEGLGANERERIADHAAQEFSGLERALRERGITTITVQDTPEPYTPDSIFPNNWISLHDDGTMVLYPMEALNRREERRPDIISNLIDRLDYVRIHSLAPFERLGLYLEGTGSLVLDRINGIAYANISSRMHPVVLEDFCRWMHFRPITFTAYRANGSSIYHTNVMMALGADTAVICSESIPNAAERRAVLDSLKEHQTVLVEISPAQMEHFAGNMLQVQNAAGERFWIMSSRAYKSLTAQQIRALEHDSSIIHAPLDLIERYGGGSARCMLAEVFKPLKPVKPVLSL